MATSRSECSFSKRIRDSFYLIGTALLVCALGVSAFELADTRHINPLWIFFPLLSVLFSAMAWEEYRKEFRSVRFILFVLGWMIINLAVLVVILSSFGWLYLIPALLLEQFLFYMTAYWLFDLQPSKARLPFSSEK